MSAVVCGKRSSIFGDELIPSSPPSPPHHHPSKRARCSPTRAFDDAYRRETLLHHLHSLFPHMDPKVRLPASFNWFNTEARRVVVWMYEGSSFLANSVLCECWIPFCAGVVNEMGITTLHLLANLSIVLVRDRCLGVKRFICFFRSVMTYFRIFHMLVVFGC